MKTLLINIRKGGTGKSAIATQLAYYLSDIKKQRVLFLDFDDQQATTNLFSRGKIAGIAPFSTLDVFTKKPEKITPPENDLVFVPSEREIQNLEKYAEHQNTFIKNLRGFIELYDQDFGYCIIDSSPAGGMRLEAALMAAQFVLSPTDVKQEAIDGLPLLIELLANAQKDRARYHEQLVFLGILPNRFDKGSPLQTKNLETIVKGYKDFIFWINKKQYGFIPERSIIAEAQEAGIPFWRVKSDEGKIKTTARSAWHEIAPVFEVIFQKMEKHHG